MIGDAFLNEGVKSGADWARALAGPTGGTIADIAAAFNAPAMFESKSPGQRALSAAHNIAALIKGKEAKEEGTWNAVCLADFGDRGVAFVAQPQIPPRNVNWSSEGRWVHLAKIAYEKYFMRKLRNGTSEPIYEKYILKALGIVRLMR